MRHNNQLLYVMLKVSQGLFTSCDLKHLIDESKIMAKFDHPNVMKLLGVSISKCTPFIIMPFMAHGSVLSYLRKNRVQFTVEDEEKVELVYIILLVYVSLHQYLQIREYGLSLLSMCLQIAKGIEYLWLKKFVHRDLAARNCMLVSHQRIKYPKKSFPSH